MSLLGVSYGVSRDELRLAYHKKMRQLHPDITHQKEDRSAEMTEAVEAQEFLSQHLFGRSKNQEKSGRYHLYLTPPELSSGTILKRAAASCDDCLGTGYLSPITCSACHGTGSEEIVHDHMATRVKCRICHGSGEIKRPCRSCHDGRKIFENLTIPKASKPGDKIKSGVFLITLGLKSANADARSGRKSERPDYAIHGEDITMTQQVPYTTMVMGGKISVDLPSGGVREIEVPEFCPSGKKIKVKNGGINGASGRGDMVLTLVPKTPTAEQASGFFVRMALKLLRKNGL